MGFQGIQPVVLAGGSGTRLWPVSRTLLPKQFAALTGERSLFEETLARLSGIGLRSPIVIGNEEHRFILAEQLRSAGCVDGRILLEPEGRNTAPAIALAARFAVHDEPDALLFVLPSDHWIGRPDELERGIHAAVEAAKTGRLVTFGIQPKSPHTGYGYIRSAGPLGGIEGVETIAMFREKPNAATAAAWVAEGGWFWNSGMFLFRAQDVLREIASLAPEVDRGAATAMAAVEADGDFRRPAKDPFLALPSVPFDIAVMEKTALGAVVPVDPDWTDLGDWDSVQAVLPADETGNTVRGDVIALGARNSVLHSSGPLLAAVGVEDMVVVATDDAVLVTPRKASQEVRQVVERLRVAGRDEADVHRTVHRPWGSYRSLALNERYQVKEIVVRPGARLSLQLHRHRSEHWVVVSGAALVTIGADEKIVHENESIYVPVGTKHRLANPGKIPLRLIEVQTGSYLGEDDIVRFEDGYGRR